MNKFPGVDKRETEIEIASMIRAEMEKLFHEERDKDRALLERMVNHLTVPPRSTWRVVQLSGDDTPHDVAIEFPAQVVYIDNGSTENVQVRAPGDIAQSPPIAASGQGRWLVPGATQVTVTGSGTGQVRLRFLNDAAARLLADNPPGGSTTSPAYVSLTGGSIPAGSATIGAVNEQRYNGSAWEDVYNNTQGTLLASAARTANGVSATMTNWNESALLLSLDVTVASGTGGLDVRLIAPPPVGSGSPALDVPSTTLITTTGNYLFLYGMSLANGGPVSGSQVYKTSDVMVPRTWSVIVTTGDSSSYTYSLGYSLVG